MNINKLLLQWLHGQTVYSYLLSVCLLISLSFYT